MADLSSRTAKVLRCATVVVEARKTKHDPVIDLDEAIDNLDKALRDLHTYVSGATP